MRIFTFLLPLFVTAAVFGEISTAEPTVTFDPFITEAQRTFRYGDVAGSVLGDDPFPRAATTLNAGLLRTYAVTRVEDLSVFVPGATSAPLYGIAGVPMIRGDLGDVAQNGQRKTYNRNAFPVSFNAIEAVEILPGAAPVFLGYTNGTGGFANYLTKRPSFARSTTLAATIGAWNSHRFQLDTTAPLSPTLAYRVSVERTGSDAFHRLAGEDSWDVFAALAWRPRAGVRWDFSIEGYSVRFVENPGTNRPTQALIDRGEYITGSSVQNGGGGSYFGNTFTPTGTVRLDGSQVLIAPDDDGWARTFTAQLEGNFELAAGRRLVSRTYFEWGAGEKYSGYTFYSYFPRNRTLEQRLELTEERRWAGLDHALLWGASLRGEERLSYVDFFNEAMNAFDLTLDPSTYRFPPELLFGVRPVPGRPNRFAVSGANYGVAPTASLSQTLHSRLANAGVFAQDRIELPSRFSLLLGARVDVVAVATRDPLPPAGFAAVRDSITKTLPAGSASLGWRPTDSVATYFTWQRAAAVESSSGSGGFGFTNNRLPDELFENASELLEAGARFITADQRWTGHVAIYRQHRHRTNARFGTPDEILVRGIEGAVDWRAAPRLGFAANATVRDAHYLNGPLPRSIATVPQFDPAQPSDNFPDYPTGDYRLPGLPRWQANAFAHFAVTPQWNARVWGSWQGAQNLDLFGRVVIRPQHTWNAALTWRGAQWELSAELLNLTDEFNWRPTSTPFAGADLVTRELPRHWRVRVSRSF